MATMTPAALKELTAFLERRCGLSFSEGDFPSLSRKIEDRMLACRTDSPAAYFALVSSPEGLPELKELLNQVTINETFFFRIPAHLRVFADEILPALAARRSKERRLRVWSAGCSTGEEPYSLAIQIVDSQLFHGWDVRVYGTDIGENVVEKARQGLYRGRSIQTVAPRFLASYFESRPDGYLITDEVRSLCEFQVHNLVADPPPAARIDVIFFRNVMIYFQPSTTTRIIDTFARVIPEDGFLVIGPSETLWRISDRFFPHFRGDCFFYRKFSAEKESAEKPAPLPPPQAEKPAPPTLFPMRFETGRTMPIPVQPAPPAAAGREEGRPKAASVTDRERLRMVEDFLGAGGYPEAMNVLETLGSSMEVLFLRCECALAMGRHALFLEWKDRLLEKDPLHIEVRYLNALYLSNRGLAGAAREELQKILFVNENAILPRYALMLLLEREGKRDQSRQEGRNLLRIIESGRGQGFRQKLHDRQATEKEILQHCKNKLKVESGF